MVCIADDIELYGVDNGHDEAMRDHDQKLRMLLQRTYVGIRNNKDKLKLGKEEISSHGHLVTNKGFKLDPANVEALQQM